MRAARWSLALALLAAAVVGMPFMDPGGPADLGEAQQSGSPFSVSLPELTQEISDRKTEGTTLDSRITSEAGQRQTDIDAATAATTAVKALVTAESTARTAAVGTLTGDVAGLKTALTTATTDEDTKINAEKTRIDTAMTDIAAEQTAREADTKTLTANMATLTSTINAKVDGDKADIAQQVQDAVTKVTGTITGNTAAATSNTEKINEEEVARKAADDKYKAEIQGLSAKVGELVGALQDVQQGKAIDIPALQARMNQQQHSTSYASGAYASSKRED